MAQHNTPKLKRIISDTSLKKYLHPINTKNVTTAAITIPFRFLKKLTSSNSLYFFKSKNINIPVMYIADKAVARANPFIPMTNGRDRFSTRFISTPIVAFLAGVALSLRE